MRAGIPRTAHAAALAAAALAGLLAAPRPARADLADLGKRLVTLEAEVGQLERDLAAVRGPVTAGDAAERRFIEGEVAFRMESWATASIILYDVVEKHPGARSWRQAVFLLAEALFQKRDYVSSRAYFRKLVSEFGEASPHYQDALQRLLEIALALRDTSDVQEYLDRLDQVPAARRLESAPYARGKYAFFAGDHDGALRAFSSIPRTSRYFLRGRYFIAASHVARGDVEAATKAFVALLGEPASKDPKVARIEARVRDLAHMGLGRLYYEAEDTSRAIDQYLMIPRESDLFDEATTEIAWVYVKAKEYDKALRALELLSLANSKSAAAPAIRILQGNLSIHRAQSMVADGRGNAAEAYAAASGLFEATKEQYDEPRQRLEKLLANEPDPARYLRLLTTEGARSLATELAIPETAVTFARQDEDMRRVVVVAEDLDGLRAELDSSREVLARLERGVSTPASVAMFPDLADRRFRAQDLGDRVLRLRAEVTGDEAALINQVASPAERAKLEELRRRRVDLSARLATAGGGSTTERVARARSKVGELDKQAQEVEVLIGSLEAEARALDRYFQASIGTSQARLPAALYEARMREVKEEIAGLRVELAALRQEIAIAQDAAGLGDEEAVQVQVGRKDLDEAVRAEGTYLSGLTSRLSGDARRRADELHALVVRLDGADGKLALCNRRIDQVLDARLADTRATLGDERARLQGLAAELERLEGERDSLGGELATRAFEKIGQMFYQIVVRAELGVVDVAWAQMEDSKRAQTRLNFESSRERKVLEEDFKEIDEEPPAAQATPGGEAPAPGEGAPAPADGAPATGDPATGSIPTEGSHASR